MINKKYNIGYALSGGGARAFAHLGAIQVLIDNDIKPDVISGVSAGALAGAFIADGFEPAEIMDIFGKMKFREFTEFTIPYSGISKTTRLQAFLKKHLKAKRFEDLNIPLIVVATDFDKGKTVHFSEGFLYEPVAASCSFPVVFAPTVINEVNYIDGGLFKNFPVSSIRKQCKNVIGINVSPLAPEYAKDNLIGVIEKCIHYVLDATTVNDVPLCDILISPTEVSKYSIFDVKLSKEIFDLGYNEALKVIADNKKVLRKKRILS